MLAALELLAQLSGMGIEIKAHGDRIRYCPRSAMTPALLTAARCSKTELLKILKGDTLSQGPGVGEQCTAGSRATPLQDSIPQNRRVDDAKVDAEFDRFARVAQPMPGGGWHDPINSAPQLPDGHIAPHPSEKPPGVPAGWSVDGWRKHLLHMADSCERMNAEKASEYRRKAQALEIAT